MLFVTVHLSLLVLAGCPTGDECTVTPIPAAGKIRGGFAVNKLAGPVTGDATAGALECEACDEVLSLDPDLAILARRPVEAPFASPVIDPAVHDESVVTAPDGTTFVVHSDNRGLTDRDPPKHDLTAYSASGTELWHQQLAQTFVPLALTASGDSAYIDQDGELTAFAAKDGSIRWKASNTHLLSIARSGGLVANVGDGTSTTVAVLEPLTGVPRWSKSIASTGKPFTRFVATDGGVIFESTFSGTIDLGDATLTARSNDKLIALFDSATGATRFAVDLGEVKGLTFLYELAVDGDSVVIAGESDQPAFGLALGEGGEDGFVARVAASGIVASHVLGGPGRERVTNVQVGKPGVVLISAESATKADAPATIAGQTLPAVMVSYALALEL